MNKIGIYLFALIFVQSCTGTEGENSRSYFHKESVQTTPVYRSFENGDVIWSTWFPFDQFNI